MPKNKTPKEELDYYLDSGYEIINETDNKWELSLHSDNWVMHLVIFILGFWALGLFNLIYYVISYRYVVIKK